MAIDPRIYKKYSGRSGDPYDRLGAALSQQSAQKQRLGAAKDETFSSRYFKVRLQVLLIRAAIGLIVLIIGGIIWLFR